MSKEPTTNAMSLPLAIQAQYVKDLSFENPSPIASFTNETNVQPSITVGVQAKAENLGGRNFEVILDIRIDATRDKNPLFLAELTYAGIVTLADSVAEDEAGPLLMVDTPRLLFPFARNIMADLTRDGGFPPIMLAPVDFAGLYEQQKNQAAQGKDDETSD